MSLEMRMTGRARQVDKSDRRTRSIQFRIEAGRGRRGKGQDRRRCYRGVFLRRQKRDGDAVDGRQSLSHSAGLPEPAHLVYRVGFQGYRELDRRRLAEDGQIGPEDWVLMKAFHRDAHRALLMGRCFPVEGGYQVEEVEPKRQVGNQRWKPPVERLIPVEGIRSNVEEVDAELAVAESAYGVGGRPTDLEREVFARWRIGAVRIPCGRGIVALSDEIDQHVGDRSEVRRSEYRDGHR